MAGAGCWFDALHSDSIDPDWCRDITHLPNMATHLPSMATRLPSVATPTLAWVV